MKIVVFAPTTRDLDDALATLGRDVDVFIVSTSPVPSARATPVAVGSSRAWSRLSELARRTAPGRVLRRLTPLDPGVAFARRVRRSAAARAAIDSADLLVSVERDAQFTVWTESRRRSRRGTRVAAVSGFPAARSAVQRLSDGS